ncbi:MAG: PKD domain-containing protein, partial [Anaerolineales bacterium]
MKSKFVKQLSVFAMISVLLIGLELCNVCPVFAMEAPKPPTNVVGSLGNMFITSNAIGYPADDPHIGYLKPVTGKCTDQPIFTLAGSGDDNNFFSLGTDAQGTYLDHLEYDQGRDEFTIHLELVCFLDKEIAYEDYFVIYVAPQLNIGSDQTMKLGDAFSRVGFFTDPGPVDNWTLYVNYGDAVGEYEAGWESLNFNPTYRDFELYHNYVNDGLYHVSVRAVNERGHVGESSIQLIVNHSPIADAGGPYNILEHGDVLLDASGSYDSQYSIVNYEWDLDHDGAFDDGTGSTFATWYEDDTGGPFAVWVKVTNTEGQSDTAFAYVYVTNVAPSLAAPTNGSIDEGQTFTYAWPFTDPGHDSWTATINYGDNSAEQTISLPSRSIALNHTYKDEGIYTITVSVQDDDGGQDTGTLSVTVKDTLPSIDTLVASPQTIDEGETVSFSATYSNPNPFDTHTILWEFGDGNSAAGFLTPTNDYLDNNGLLSYTAALKITDDDGNLITKTIDITVNNVAPIVAAISGPATADTGENVSFNANFTDQGVRDHHSATWFWGDGSSSSGLITDSNGVKKVTGTHTFNTAGDFTIHLIVQDDDGDSGRSPDFKVFVPPSPVINLISDFSWWEANNFEIIGSFEDPTSESWSATVDYDDGNGEQQLPLHSDKTFLLDHKYDDDGHFNIVVKITNNYGKVGSATISVDINNIEPWFTWEYNIVT